MSDALTAADEFLHELQDAEGEFIPPQTVGREVLDWMDFSETGIDPDDIPEPTIWRVLVFPKQPKRMTASGIALPSMAQSVERHLNYIGQVVAMGPIAGKSERFRRPDGTLAWDIKVGDWVIYGRYSGQHVEYQGVELLTVNDDDITMRIKNPAGFRVYL